MFFSSSGGSEPLSVSKTDILRGIITEKLNTAAREILAVVERTVTDYEAEASGFRQEIDRQRRQLELLLPQVKLHREELVPDQRSHEEVGVGEEEEQLPQQPDEEEAERLLPSTSDDDEQFTTIFSLMQEDLKDPDYEIPSRSDSSRGHSVRKRPARPQIRDACDVLHLRIWLLEDPDIKVLSNKVFKKAPVQDLNCPRGLQETVFMALLRSTFPQLADGEPFDFFTSDRSRKLLPLEVKALTPEEIYTTINSTGRLALYIQLKNGKEKEISNTEELHDVPRTTDPPSTDPVLSKSDETDLHTSLTSPELDLETAEDGAGSDVDSSNDGEEMIDRDDGWSPDPELQTIKKHRKNSNIGKQTYKKRSCKVCGLWYRQLGALIKHTWSHVDQKDVCGFCGEKFESVEELKKHHRNHQKLHSCSVCGKTFTNTFSLNKHTARHAKSRVFKCRTCEQTFTDMSGLYHHRLLHMEEKPHKCDVCPKSFALKELLEIHRGRHARKEEFHCRICNKSFTNRRSVAIHKFVHSGERRHACNVCGKRFKTPGTLRSHMKTHTVQDRPFLCHICSKTFPSEQSLKVHIQSHSSERPFVCEMCGKTFPSKGSLTSHFKAHSSETPYKCSVCGHCFKHKSNLKEHDLLHSSVKNFVCGICGKACYRREHLRVHMRTHTGERPYKCTFCDKAFTQSHCLKTHMKSHQTKENADPDPSQSFTTSSAEPPQPTPSSGEEQLNSELPLDD